MIRLAIASSRIARPIRGDKEMTLPFGGLYLGEVDAKATYR